MKQEAIVQFIIFETTLDTNAFITRWTKYKDSASGGGHVILQQQRLENGVFRYISQHDSSSAEFNFRWEKEREKSKLPMEQIRKKLAGGYKLLQLERVDPAKKNESKILIFLLDSLPDLDGFRHFTVHGKLNIYEAYFENCEYSYILELFVSDDYASSVLQQLKILTSFAEAGVYKECHSSVNLELDPR